MELSQAERAIVTEIMSLDRSRAIPTVIFVGALVSASCTHQVQSASRGAPTRPAPIFKTQRAESAVNAGPGDVEILVLRQRMAANSKDLDARVLLARAYMRRGLPDLALEHYRLAAAQFPDSSTIALALAKTLREIAQPIEALRVTQDFVRRNPGASWELLSLEGILEDESGQFGAAEAAHRAALAIGPGRASLHNNLGYNLMLQGNYQAAEEEFRSALEIDPKSKIAHNNLGSALVARSRPAVGEALSEWQRAGDPAVAHNNFAAVLIEQKRYPEARSEIQAALGLRPGFPAALANLRLIAEKDGLPATLPRATAQRDGASKAAKLATKAPVTPAQQASTDALSER